MSRERRSEWFSLTARCLLLLPLVVPVLVLPVSLLDLDFLEGRVLNGTLEEKDIVVSDSCLSRKRVRWSEGFGKHHVPFYRYHKLCLRTIDDVSLTKYYTVWWALLSS